MGEKKPLIIEKGTSITIGSIIVTLLATGTWVFLLPGHVSFNVGLEQTELFIFDSAGNQLLAGVETGHLGYYNEQTKIFYGLSPVGDPVIDVSVSDTNKTIFATRTTHYEYNENPIQVIDKYILITDGDVTKLPFSHTVEVIGGKDLSYIYAVDGLTYDGPSMNVSSPIKVGRQTSIEWSDGYYFATLYENGSLNVRFFIDTEDTTFAARMYDPTWIIDPSSTGFGSQNRSNNLQNLTNTWRQYNSTFTGRLRDGKGVEIVPWFKRSDQCLMNNDATNGFRICSVTTGIFSSANHTNETFCTVTDEASQVMLSDALGSMNGTRMDNWINTIEATNCGMGGNLTEWTTGWWYNKSGEHWVADCGQVSDSASDADAHFIVGLAVINNSEFANTSVRAHAGTVLGKMCYGFATENFINSPIKSRVNGDTIDYIPCGGTNVCTSLGANSITWLGYYGPILEALAGCRAYLGDNITVNYTKLAQNAFQTHLIASNWTGGTSFTIGYGRQYHWANYSSTGTAYAVCDGNCIYMDDPDGMRAPRMCNGARVWRDFLGVNLTNASTYCQNWHNLAGETATQHVRERNFDGSARSAADSGFKSVGLGAFMNTYVNTSLADDRIDQYNTHIGVTNGKITMDSQACFGVYDKAFGMMALGFLMGRADAAFSGNGSSGSSTTNLTIGDEQVNASTIVINGSVKIRVNVTTAGSAISKVIATVTYPNGTAQNITLTSAGGNYFDYNWSQTASNGTYPVTPFRANTTSTESLTQASSLQFIVNASSSPSSNLTPNITIGNVALNISGNVLPGVNAKFNATITNVTGNISVVKFEIRYPNATKINVTASRVVQTTTSGGTGNDSNLIANQTYETGADGWTGNTDRDNGGGSDTYLLLNGSGTMSSGNLSLRTGSIGVPRNYTMNFTISSALANYSKIYFASSCSSTVGPRIIFEYSSANTYNVKHEGGAYCTAYTGDTAQKLIIQIFADNTNNQTTFKVFNGTNGSQLGSTCSANSYITNPSSGADCIRIESGTQGANSGVKLYNLIVWSGTGPANDGNGSATNTSGNTSSFMYNLTSITTAGQYNFTAVYANNTWGETNSSFSSSLGFYVTSNAPNVSLIAPTNNSNTTITSQLQVNFSFNVTDDVDTSFVCSLFTNTTGSWLLNQTQSVNTLQSSFFLNLSMGSYVWNVRCNDSENNLAFATNNFTFLLSTLAEPGGSNFTLIIDGLIRNITAELGTRLNISANTTAGTVCIDVDHPQWGVNVSCGTGLTSIIINISYFEKKIMSDGTSRKNLSFINGANQSFNVSIHKLDEIDSISLYVDGFKTNNTFPTGIQVYVNNTLSNTVGLIINTTEGSIGEFNDSTTYKTVSFTSAVAQTIGYIRLPKNANITSATVNFTGQQGYTLQEVADALYVEFRGNITANYTKINGSTNTTLWQFKYASSFTNFSVGACWNASTSKIQLHYGAYKDAGNRLFYAIECWNGSTYVSLAGGTTGTCSGGAACTNGATASSSYLYDSDYSTNAWYDYNSNEWYTGSGSGYDGIKMYEEGVWWNAVPSNLWFEAGVINGTRDWNYTGAFNISDVSRNFSAKISSYLASCTADTEGYCTVPLTLYSDGATVNVTNLQVNFTYAVNPIVLSNNIISRFQNQSSDTNNLLNLSIKVISTLNGTLQITNLSIKYAGGNYTMKVTSHNTSYTANQSYNITWYHTRWNYTFAPYVQFIEFIPKTPTSKNVSAYGQLSGKPVLNFTNLGYGGRPANFSLQINSTYSCVNISEAIDGNITNAQQLGNGTWLEIYTDRAYLSNYSVWLYANYGCNNTAWRTWQPNFYFRACASGVDRCSNETT